MGCKYNTNHLPDDIISYLSAFLTVGDALRVRLSSARWLHLPDSRSVLDLNSLNVLGTGTAQEDSPAVQSKFVKIVNGFLQVWAGKRIHKLVVKFILGQEHSSHIDSWIATSVRMQVEEIKLNFSGISQERYVFPSDLIHFGTSPYLKRLYLQACTLNISSQCNSWLSNLTTLHLSNVPLRESDIDCILSGGSNLVSLKLFSCKLPRLLRINGRHVCFKKLSICDSLFVVMLKCPSLEVFEYYGMVDSIMFAHVPILREAKLWPILAPECFVQLIDKLNRYTPHLQVLSLMIHYEVKLLRSTLSCLKVLKISVLFGFDLLSITHLLNASPILEELHIKLNGCGYIKRIEGRKWHQRPHFHLKQVKFEEFHDEWNGMKLATCLLKNAVALEQMVIELSTTNVHSRLRWMVRTQLQEQKINPTLQVIII